MGAWPHDLRRAASRSQTTSGPAGPRTARAATARRRGRPTSPSTAACSRPPTGCATRPGACCVVACASAAERDRFLDRLIEDRASLLSLDKVRGAAGRARRRGGARRARRASCCSRPSPSAWRTARRSCSPPTASTPAEREPFVRMAAALKRPRHLILLETAREQVREEDLADAQRAAPRARRRRARRRGLSDRAAPRRRHRRARSSGSCSARRRAKTTSARSSSGTRRIPAGFQVRVRGADTRRRAELNDCAIPGEHGAVAAQRARPIASRAPS